MMRVVHMGASLAMMPSPQQAEAGAAGQGLVLQWGSVCLQMEAAEALARILGSWLVSAMVVIAARPVATQASVI